jgi:outer membrane protein OmpA-like peptidoglycan-associated protein
MGIDKDRIDYILKLKFMIKKYSAYLKPMVRENRLTMKYNNIILLCFMLLFSQCQHNLEFNVIHFTGYTEIAPEDSVLLSDNLQLLQDNPNINVELNGYTDSIDPDSWNLIKSQARADTIKSWLVINGISSLRITAIGHGENNPVGDNRTAEGRALNNRVEFIVK